MRAPKIKSNKISHSQIDPSLFGDEIASRTSWKKISKGNVLEGLSRGYRLAHFTNKQGNTVLGYKKTSLFFFFFSMLALLALYSSVLFYFTTYLWIYEPQLMKEFFIGAQRTMRKTKFTFLVFWLGILSSWLCYIKFLRQSKKPFFDKTDCYVRYGENNIHFSDVYAIQLNVVECIYFYLSHRLNSIEKNIQLNLVLRDASRIAIKNYTKSSEARHDAVQIANYIGLPASRIWDGSVGLL